MTAGLVQPAQMPTSRWETWRYSRHAAYQAVSTSPCHADSSARQRASSLGALEYPVWRCLDGRLVIAQDRQDVGASGFEFAEDHAFTRLNRTFTREPVVVRVAAGETRSLHLMFEGSTTPATSYSRLVVQIDRGGALNLVEEYLGGAALTNTLGEYVVGPGGTLRHLRVQYLDSGTACLGQSDVRLEERATYRHWQVSLGAETARWELDVELFGREAEATLAGLLLGQGSQQLEHIVRVRHRAEAAESRQEYRSILDGHATGTFHGAILVEREAQKTDARQQSHGLLLSPSAALNARPQLEIYADDVKCSHGATVGALDQEALFYLRSRGLSQAQARALLVRAFAARSLEDLPEDWRGPVEALVQSRIAAMVGDDV